MKERNESTRNMLFGRFRHLNQNGKWRVCLGFGTKFRGEKNKEMVQVKKISHGVLLNGEKIHEVKKFTHFKGVFKEIENF